MFGYIRVSKPEMRIKEYEMYKAIYCSLCKELGKGYGPLSRLTLSYDFAFLAILNMSLTEEKCSVCRRLCTSNPFKKCNFISDRAPIKMPSAAAMIMLYYKLLDNIEDERGIKRLGYKLTKGIFSSAHKKAARDYPQIEEIFSVYIGEQKRLEAENCCSIDAAAEPTAKALSLVFEECSADGMQKRVLSRLGYCIGRYIYILDAAVDLPEDIKKGSYNPLRDTEGSEDYIKSVIVPSLYITVSEAAKALELLDIKKFKNIIDNIVYLGLEDTIYQELKIKKESDL